MCGRGVVIIVGAMLLTGCAVSGQFGYQPAIPAGSELVLHQRLPIGAGGTRVYIQGGEVVDRDEVNRFRVACFIRIQRRGEEPLVNVIRPGRLLVIEGSRSWARGRPDDNEFGLMERSSRLDFFTEAEIRSDRQPQVDELHCEYNGWRTGEAPGWTAIQEALGEVASLRRPHEDRWARNRLTNQGIDTGGVVGALVRVVVKLTKA